MVTGNPATILRDLMLDTGYEIDEAAFDQAIQECESVLMKPLMDSGFIRNASNYQILLQKYIQHVQRCEGVHFLEDDLRRSESDDPDTPLFKLFTDDEWKELRRIAEEIA